MWTRCCRFNLKLIIKCQADVVQYVNEIRIDGEVYKTTVNTNPTDYTDMEVYASNDFTDSFEGRITKVSTENIF